MKRPERFSRSPKSSNSRGASGSAGGTNNSSSGLTSPLLSEEFDDGLAHSLGSVNATPVVTGVPVRVNNAVPVYAATMADFPDRPPLPTISPMANTDTKGRSPAAAAAPTYVAARSTVAKVPIGNFEITSNER